MGHLPDHASGFFQDARVFVGLNPDPKCYRAVSFMEMMQYNVTVVNETHPDSNGECPWLEAEGVSIGGWEQILRTVRRI